MYKYVVVVSCMYKNCVRSRQHDLLGQSRQMLSVFVWLVGWLAFCVIFYFLISLLPGWCSVSKGEANFPLPWIPEVFSRVRREASFRRPQADTFWVEGRRPKTRAEKKRADLTEIGNRAWKASGTQGNFPRSSHTSLTVPGPATYIKGDVRGKWVEGKIKSSNRLKKEGREGGWGQKAHLYSTVVLKKVANVCGQSAAPVTNISWIKQSIHLF